MIFHRCFPTTCRRHRHWYAACWFTHPRSGLISTLDARMANRQWFAFGASGGDIVMRDLMPLSTTNHSRPRLWRIVLGLGVMFAVLALLPWLLGDLVHAATPFSPGDLVFGRESSLVCSRVLRTLAQNVLLDL